MANNSLENTYQIEKMLKKDARQQKSIGAGVYHRASRRGYIRGGIKTPYDYMSAKERKNLNGEVKTYMIYEQGIDFVKDLKEIMEMPYDKRLEYFTNVMKSYKVRDLCSKWKISTSTLYNNYIPEIGYVKNSEAALRKAGRKKKNSNNNENISTDNKKAINNNENVINNISTTHSNIDSNTNNTILDTQQDKVNNRLIENNSFNDNNYFEQEFKLKGRYSLSNIDNIYNKIKILLDQGLLYDIEINVKEARKQ